MRSKGVSAAALISSTAMTMASSAVLSLITNGDQVFQYASAFCFFGSAWYQNRATFGKCAEVCIHLSQSCLLGLLRIYMESCHLHPILHEGSGLTCRVVLRIDLFVMAEASRAVVLYFRRIVEAEALLAVPSHLYRMVIMDNKLQIF